MKNSQKAHKLTEEKTQISNESKIQWEIPKFEEIELESGTFFWFYEEAIYDTRTS